MARASARAAGAKEPRVRLDTTERRAQLVELGLEHFGTSSYDDVSIDFIAQEAGISKGLLYHYFPTKRAFYVACVRTAAARFLAFIEPPKGGTPLEQLHAGLDAYLTFVRGHGRAFTTLMRSGVGVDSEIARIVDETRAACLHLLTVGFHALPTALLGARAGKDPLSSPLVRIALRGWIGLAEATSIDWVEATTRSDASTEPAPSQAQIRELLVSALVEVVTTAFAMKS